MKTKNIIIHVRKKHINRARNFMSINGWTNEWIYCPVALAAQERLKNKNIYAMGTYLENDSTKEYINLPNKVSEFIGAFDRKEEVKPFKFSINGKWKRLK